MAGDHVTDIKVTGDGVWVATKTGVSHFDGRVFTTYTMDDGLPEDEVREVFEDGQGRLWLATTGGVSRRDADGAFTSFTTRDGLASDRVNCIAEDAAGNLWFGTTVPVRAASTALLSPPSRRPRASHRTACSPSHGGPMGGSGWGR